MNLCIVMTTYFTPDAAGEERRAVARRILETLQHRLARGMEKVGLHVADDGSVDYAEDWKYWSFAWHAGDVTTSYQYRLGVGASLNAAIRARRDHLLLYIVDDWFLDRPFAYRPWADIMEVDRTIGAVRLFPHPWLEGQFEQTATGLWISRLDLNTGFPVSHRPTIWHPRFWEAYGFWKEGVSALDAELEFNQRVRSTYPRLLAERREADIVQAVPTMWHHHEAPSLAAVIPSPGSDANDAR